MFTDLISDTPEFNALATRITADIKTMKENAIAFLKAESAWPEDKEN